jgi:hypothetical protein
MAGGRGISLMLVSRSLAAGTAAHSLNAAVVYNRRRASLKPSSAHSSRAAQRNAASPLINGRDDVLIAFLLFSPGNIMKLQVLFSIPVTLMLSAASLPSGAAAYGIGPLGAPASPSLSLDTTRVPPAPPAPVPQPSPAFKSPSVVNWCSAGGCLDSSGNWYSGATGNLYLDNRGNPCVRTGTWLQCN